MFVSYVVSQAEFSQASKPLKNFFDHISNSGDRLQYIFGTDRENLCICTISVCTGILYCAFHSEQIRCVLYKSTKVEHIVM